MNKYLILFLNVFVCLRTVPRQFVKESPNKQNELLFKFVKSEKEIGIKFKILKNEIIDHFEFLK